MNVIFIDNGTTGSIGYYDGKQADFVLTPAKKEQDYTKAKKNVTRIYSEYLIDILSGFCRKHPDERTIAVMERPMVNPGRFLASIVAARAFEAELVLIEMLGIPHMFCDSKEWQKGLLPSAGRKGTDSATLKKESLDIGIRLFPEFEELIRTQKDADGLLGAYQFYRIVNA